MKQLQVFTLQDPNHGIQFYESEGYAWSFEHDSVIVHDKDGDVYRFWNPLEVRELGGGK